MGYQTRKTTMQLPGGIPMQVSILGVQDAAPTVNNFCCEGHDPERVRSTVACPTCGNADRGLFRRGVLVGTEVHWVEDENTESGSVKADHSVTQITAHERETVMSLSMDVGKVYAVLPQKGSEPLYANLRAWLVANPKVAAVCTWGWTTTKTSIWLLDVSMGKILMREMAHPNDVRNIEASSAEANEAMVGMLGQLLTVEDFDIDTYEDHNAAAKAAAKGQGAPVGKAKAAAPKEPDLMALMAAAVAAKSAKKAA